MRLRGRRAVVTGASSGIGRQLALDLAREGATPVLLARRAGLLERLREEIAEAGGEAEVFPCDVSDNESVRETAGAILAAGPVDILINNAGFGFAGPLLRSSPEEIERLTRTNYLGAVYCIFAFAPRMKRRWSGHIVNVASVAGLIPPPFLGAYAASKFAMVAMSRALRHELAPFRVGVSTICPGTVKTPFFDTHPSLRKPARFRKGPTLTAAQVSRKVLAAIRANRGLVVMPFSLACMALLARMVPGLLEAGLAVYARAAAKLDKED
jgi:short-subunit dehydrogenase